MTEITTYGDLVQVLKTKDHEFVLPLRGESLGFRMIRRNGQGATSLRYKNGHVINIPFPTGDYSGNRLSAEPSCIAGAEGFLDYVLSQVTPDVVKGSTECLDIGSGIDIGLAESFVREANGLEDEYLIARHSSMQLKHMAWTLAKATSETSAKNLGLFSIYLSGKHQDLCETLEPFYGHVFRTSKKAAEETGRAMAVLSKHYNNRVRD